MPRRRRGKAKRSAITRPPPHIPGEDTELVVKHETVLCGATGKPVMRTRVTRQPVHRETRTGGADWLATALEAGIVTRLQHERGRWYERLYHAAVHPPRVTAAYGPGERSDETDASAAPQWLAHDDEARTPADLLTAVRRTIAGRVGGVAALRLLDDVLVWGGKPPSPEAMRAALDMLEDG